MGNLEITFEALVIPAAEPQQPIVFAVYGTYRGNDLNITFQCRVDLTGYAGAVVGSLDAMQIHGHPIQIDVEDTRDVVILLLYKPLDGPDVA